MCQTREPPGGLRSRSLSRFVTFLLLCRPGGPGAERMPAATKTHLTVALIGNPNTGKSTLFNLLCGVRQRVGNYPGVTVEKKVGRTDFHGRSFAIVDLPGSYSLAPRSPDEMVAVDVLLGRRFDVDRPDVVVCIVDASNLERNLYLVSQVLELELPTVLALNMTDVAADKGMKVDAAKLSERLGLPVVEMQAHRRQGVQPLKQALADAVDRSLPQRKSPFPPAFQEEVERLRQATQAGGREPLPRYLVERLLLDTSGYLAGSDLIRQDSDLQMRVEQARERLAQAGWPVPGVEPISRYQWIADVTGGLIERQENRPVTWTDRIDSVLTNRVWGTVAFVAMMTVLFQAVFSVAEPASWAIDALNGWASGLIADWVPAGALRSLLIDGVIEGVGGVLVFLPQIFVLFFFIAILEDCGYMARAAYLMDKLMSRVGLSGKSFIPLLSSFACAIPGIMAARVIENPKDRLITVLIAPLMSCSARLPVYVLLIGAFIPDYRFLGGAIGLRGLTMLAMYAVGMIAAVCVALLLRRTILRGSTPPFVMELPGYKVPGVGIVTHRMVERGWSFVQRAGTLIFAVTIVVWAAGYYPRNPDRLPSDLVSRRAELEQRLASLETSVPPAAGPGAAGTDPQEPSMSPEGSATPTAASTETDPEQARDDLRTELEAELAEIEDRIAGLYLRDSYLGRAGHFVEPAVRPLGWDWRLGCAAIASFPAREVVIATLGVIYNLGDDEDEASEPLAETLRSSTWEGTDRPVFNIPVALSVMVFFALCAQCASTLAVLRRETNSWAWPAFTFLYMTVLAYLGALLTYQVGHWFLPG